MSKHIKKRIIKSLIEEITCLDNIEIELVGNNYISLRENQPMIHHGINKDYMPSGYTVDSFSDDSLIIGEYSAEKGYFEYSGTKDNPVFSKIDNDIEHALNHKENPKLYKIYLISNQEENPSFRSKFNSTENGRLHGDKLIIIDARELAKGVYEQSIKNPDAADFYKQYFPTFSQNMDNYEYFGKLPNICEGYVCEEKIVNAIKHHFDNGNNICVLYGVSGSGKTQSAIDFVRKNIGEFSNYIWIGGEDWKPNVSLCSVQRTRGGSPVNVAGLFNSEKSVLIIDNCNRAIEESSFDELTPGFEKGGVVLVTSQISEPQSSLYLSIPQFSIARALEILGETDEAASELCRNFIEKCRFSPLILSIARKLFQDQGIDKEAIYKEILDDPELVDDPTGSSIVRQILSGLDDRKINALKKIANSGKNYHDIVFLRHFIGTLSCSSLQKLSILVPESTTGVFRIHDLISISVRDEIDRTEIVDSIEKFISQSIGDMTPSVLREIHLCADLIYEEHQYRGDREIDWLHYSLLQLEAYRDLELHNDLHNIDISGSDDLKKIKTVIDAKEIYSYSITDKSSRKDYYISCSKLYEEMLERKISDEVKLELLHHRGKSLRRSDRHSDALESFNRLLEINPNWHATYGQIAHLGTQKGVDKEVKEAGENAMRLLLNYIREDIFSVPLRVSLGSLARLRSYRSLLNEIIEEPEFVDKLSDVISISTLDGLDQFYEAFVSFTTLFGYRYQHTCVNLAEAIPEIIAIPPNQVEKRQWISACGALTNSAIAAKKEQKEYLYSLLIRSALAFADEINQREELSDFDGRCIAKTYNLGCKHQDALNAIKKVPDDDVSHWLLYQKSKAFLGLGSEHLQDALLTSKESFKLASEDDLGSSRISIYHDLLSSCHLKLGDTKSAYIELSNAIEKCSDEKYKNELIVRLEYLKKNK